MCWTRWSAPAALRPRSCIRDWTDFRAAGSLSSYFEGMTSANTGSMRAKPARLRRILFMVSRPLTIVVVPGDGADHDAERHRAQEEFPPEGVRLARPHLLSPDDLHAIRILGEIG